MHHLRKVCPLLSAACALIWLLTVPAAQGAPGSQTAPDSTQAYVMRLPDTWTVSDSLDVNATLISLQGLANQGTPRLYFIYPADWTFTYTESVYEYYQDRHGIAFTELSSAQEALAQLHEHADGYVVWDPSVRTSLIVAFTAAGLEDAIVVSEDLIPLAEKYGLEPVADFRGKFTGWSDYEIYQWAYDQYWDRTSKDFIVWMGGVWNDVMEPGVADFGIYQNVFFTDLSANPADTLEYRLADQILSEMNPLGLVMGWHSYKKDTEGQHVTLVSSHALRMEGLNTLPNASFNIQIPTSPGFEFTNNHNVAPDTTLNPEEKIYVATVQTDGLGIGAWLKPGRGEIPYAWEVTMNWAWLQPALLQYFYEQATPNDYFIGMLSGPGYMYPKAVPPEQLPRLIAIADTLMDELDLRVFEIMDYSEGNRLVGNLNLPQSIVDAYYAGMPDAIGFINGYGPAQTYTVRDGVPFISYQYYLSETRQVDEAVADLRELARLNPKRPYFLLMHVRQWSTIERVQDILEGLGPNFEVVPLDVFMKLAAGEPTFETRYRSKHAEVPADLLR